MRENGLPVHWPPNPAPYLTDWLIEIGPTVAMGMGDATIGWQDMAAWQRLVGIELTPFEARALRRMSSAFRVQREEARKPDCLPPYAPSREDVIAQRDAVGQRIKAFFSRAREA